MRNHLAGREEAANGSQLTVAELFANGPFGRLDEFENSVLREHAHVRAASDFEESDGAQAA